MSLLIKQPSLFDVRFFDVCVRNCMLSTDTSKSNLTFSTFSVREDVKVLC